MFPTSKIVGPPRGRLPLSYYGQTLVVAVEPALMQFEALPSALLIDPPRVTAAIAMAPPMIARISAYSAAEAPASSLSIEIMVFISILLSENLRTHRSGGRRASGDAVRRLLHGITDRAAQRDGSDCNRAADDGEDQCIFGRRGARLVLQQVDKNRHAQFPSYNLACPPRRTCPSFAGRRMYAERTRVAA